LLAKKKSGFPLKKMKANLAQVWLNCFERKKIGRFRVNLNENPRMDKFFGKIWGAG